jgi:hypothetical protein
MALGEMLRAPKLEDPLPTVSGCWKLGAWPVERYGTEKMTRPAVLHSAWRAADGSIGIVFLNISEEPQDIAFSVNGHSYGFPPGADLTVTALGLDKEEKATRDDDATLRGGAGSIRHTMEPRGVWAVEIAPAARPR